MSNWSSGYVADIDYTHGYYNELSPLRAKLAFLHAGLVCPDFGAACELGFGQGISANVHAAATVTSWHGTDFNPSQAGFAQELSSKAGAGAKLYDETFAEFAAREDLPDFDFIGLHGIWSWISDENRGVIVDFLRRKLKVGGVLYISYNTLPGWASFAPMRHLMAAHAEVIGATGRGIISRIDGAIEFANKLLATNPLFSRANPHVADRITKIKDQNRQYLAHEFFNQDWHPMHFDDMAGWLETAKLTFACSAHYYDHIEVLNLTAEQQTFLNEIPDVVFKQSVRDFMVNQQFRRDYWVKGARKLAVVEHAELIRSTKVILTTHRPDVALKVSGSIGEANLSSEIYNPILDLLAEHKPATLGQLEEALKDKKIVISQILQVAMVLGGAGHLAAVQEDRIVSQARTQTDKLNAYIINRAKSSNEISYLASPVTGAGFSVGRFQQLFLTAIGQGAKSPAEWAQYVWNTIAAQGQKIVKEGVALDTVEANLNELNQQAKVFAEKQLPILKALQII